MMVARNLGMQDIPYTRLLLGEDKMEYVTLEELKPSMMGQNLHHTGYQPTYFELTNVNDHQSPCSSSSGLPQYHSLETVVPGPHHGMFEPAMVASSSHSRISTLNNEPPPIVDSTLNPPQRRKRKASFQSDIDDDTGEDSKSTKTDDNKKQNHSEIEKRRRDKMNTYITELSSMIPMCHAMSRKLDKLTVLRMAVQHIKTIRGHVSSYSEGHKPSFLTDQELKQLILQIADGFLFVVGCDRGRILYVSESVSNVLNYTQGDLLGQSLFDILHPKDVAKVKEQLSSSDLNPRERLIDAKTMLPVKTDIPQGASRLCPGARRSFFCRMKCKNSQQVKEEADTTTGYHRRKSKLSSNKRFSVIQCTGYLKSWAPSKVGIDDTDQDQDGDSCNLSCLVAIGRTLPHISSIAGNSNEATVPTRPIQFVSRHALDGKFIFVDQRATLVLGFLPQELLGTSMYEYYHQDDIHAMADRHKMALQTNDYVITNAYRFRTKEGTYLKLQSEFKAFTNPWTKEIEYLIAKNNLVLSDFRIVESTANRPETLQESFNDFFSSANGKDIQKIINTHVEASKIGRQIAEQVHDLQRTRGLQDSSCSHSSDPHSSLHYLSTNNESSISTSLQSSESYQSGLMMTDYGQRQPQQALFDDSRFNLTFGASTTNTSSESGSGAPGMMDAMLVGPEDTSRGPHAGGPGPQPSMDGNDEAAMAVIMSLLEADAGLGGPVDFSGLPWPLP